MKRFVKYSARYESLTEGQKKSFFSLQSVMFPMVQNHFVNLLEQSSLRAGSCPHGRFFDEEIIRATNELTAIGLDCDWSEVRFQLNEIRKEIKAGRVPNNYGLYAENDIFERELRVLLLNVLNSSGLLSEYLQAENSGGDPLKSLQDIDKVTDILTRFRMLVFLTARTESEIPIDERNEVKRTLADIALQYVWEGKRITNQNKDAIAAQFPDMKLKNGIKLYQKFSNYSKRGERVFDRGDDRKNIKHLKNMETALKFLSKPEQIQSAEKEILSFKAEVKRVSGQIL